MSEELHGTWRTALTLREVAMERARQDAKWGEQNHPMGTSDRLGYAAETAKMLCKREAACGTVTWRHIIEEEFWEAMAEEDPARLRAELVQVAAVAVAMIECLDRKSAGGGK